MKIIVVVLGVIALSLINSEIFSLMAMSVGMVMGLAALFKTYQEK